MQATAITMMGRRQPDEDARRRAMVRLNGMMFYSLALASFLESTPPLDTHRLIRLSGDDPDVGLWLDQQWLPSRARRGRLLKDYIEATWPEFDWNSAYEEFSAAYASRTAARVERPGLALEFFARCAIETMLAVFYRTLVKCADEPSLRALASEAAQDHVAYFNRFRGLYDRFSGGRHAGLAMRCHTIFEACRSVREVDVAAAFHPLVNHWHGGWVFPEFTYPEYLARLALLIKRHAALGFVERLLFRAWLNPPRNVEALARPAAASGARKGPAMAPALRAA
jgi:hypothetical protein